MLLRENESRRKSSVQLKQKKRESKRENPPSRQAAASPTSSRSWKKLLPSVCVTQADNTEGGSRGVGECRPSEPNPADVPYPQHSLAPARHSPEPHYP